MRVLHSGTTALLVELGDLEEVLSLYAALERQRPAGVVDLVPAARTLLVVTDPAVADLDAVARAVTRTAGRPHRGSARTGTQLELPVSYDGEDLAEAAAALGCGPREVVRRHTEEDWTVAFCGFAPGFGYLTGRRFSWDVPRRAVPRTAVPAGAVALAGEFTGVYPRESPGGWLIIGRTHVTVFDLTQEPPALLRPGTRVRFVDAGGR